MHPEMPTRVGYTPESPSIDADGTTDDLALDRPLTFPLFKLPAELRLHIYSYVLVQAKQPLRVIRRADCEHTPRNHATAILATNHQVYSEARPVFLSGNTFMIRGNLVDHKWLNGLGREGWKYLRNVTLLDGSQLYSFLSKRCLDLLSKCPGLSLTIKIHCTQLYNLDMIGVFENLHGFKQATAAEILPGLYRACRKRNHAALGMSSSWAIDEGEEYVENLLGKLESPCPSTCSMHKARDTLPYTASVHIDCDYGCEYCYRNKIPSEWQWQWNKS